MLYKTKKNTNTLRALSATKHEHIIEKYATMETIYTPPSQFQRDLPSNGIHRNDVTRSSQHRIWQSWIPKIKMGQGCYWWRDRGCNRLEKALETSNGRLFQGCGRKEDGTQCSEGTNACHWIREDQVPKEKTVTYNRAVADIRPEKEDPYRVWFTAWWNIPKHKGETLIETAPIETEKKTLTVLYWQRMQSLWPWIY